MKKPGTFLGRYFLELKKSREISEKFCIYSGQVEELAAENVKT